MRGPYERLKYDFRRVWECPVCHRRERTGGEVTSCVCHCQRKAEPRERKVMRLVEDGARRTDGKETRENHSAAASDDSST